MAYCIVFYCIVLYRIVLFLQLLLSPVLLTSLDQLDRCERDQHLRQGNLLLTGLQFRGHAMFSEIDRPLGADTLEYAWLMEIQSVRRDIND